MPTTPTIVYAGEEAPLSFTKSVFLAGPTPRSPDVPSWRPEALRLFEELGYDGVVFVPEARSGMPRPSYTDQVEWEQRHLNMSDCILCWVPRDLTVTKAVEAGMSADKVLRMPAFTTNVEFGMWIRSGKLVFGAPDSAVHVSYLKHCAEGEYAATATTLEDTVAAAMKLVGAGAERTGGEREVPLIVWRTPAFQAWYTAQTKAGNRLDGARVEWVFRVGPTKGFLFLWALHVNVYIAAENRHKTNEVVLSRPDISSVVLYRKAEQVLDTEVVLVREFRSPGRTADGFVRENAGGSSWKPGKNPRELVSDECHEETGLLIEPERFVPVGARQVAGTLSAHMAHVFAAELTAEELAWVKSEAGIVRGVEGDSERTYVEVWALRELLAEPLTDWSTLGMLCAALR